MGGGEAYQLTDSQASPSPASRGRRTASSIAFLAVDTLPESRRSEAAAARRSAGVRGQSSSVARLGRRRRREEGERDRARRLHGEGRAVVVARRPRLAYQASPTTLLRETRTDAYVVTVADQHNERISRSPDVAHRRPCGRRTDARSPTRRCRRATRRAPTASPTCRSATIISAVRRRRRNATKDVYDAKADVSAGTPQWTRRRQRAFCSRRASARTPPSTRYDVASGKLSTVVDKTLLRGLSFSSRRKDRRLRDGFAECAGRRPRE